MVLVAVTFEATLETSSTEWTLLIALDRWSAAHHINTPIKDSRTPFLRFLHVLHALDLPGLPPITVPPAVANAATGAGRSEEESYRDRSS